MKIWTILGVWAVLAGSAGAAEVTVFAASSLKTALDRIAADWQAATGNTALVSYDNSSRLAKQIIEGAPAEVFFSAAEMWMDEVDARDMIRPGSRRAVLGNALVLVAHGSQNNAVDLVQGFDLHGLLGDDRLAMGAVDSVPAGQYGKDSLTRLGMWDAVAAQVVEVDSARSALSLVARGEAGFGIVYRSDAVADDLAGDDVFVVATFPPSSHRPITYPVALTNSASPLADDFLAFLQGDAADQVFADLGFTVLP